MNPNVIRCAQTGRPDFRRKSPTAPRLFLRKLLHGRVLLQFRSLVCRLCGLGITRSGGNPERGWSSGAGRINTLRIRPKQQPARAQLVRSARTARTTGQPHSIQSQSQPENFPQGRFRMALGRDGYASGSRCARLVKPEVRYEPHQPPIPAGSMAQRHT